MKVLCISGYAGSGKDTLATMVQNVLRDVYCEPCKIIHYADLLKYICKEHFGWDGKKDDKGRNLLQRVGTNVFREMDADYWVKTMIPIMKAINKVSGIEVFIIPDCRFENEVSWMKENFDTIHVRVVRSRPLAITKELFEHASEHGLDDVEPDVWVQNDGEIDNLLSPAMTLASWVCSEYDNQFKAQRRREVDDVQSKKKRRKNG